MRTPIGLINHALKAISDHEQANANINSMTTATLTNLVLQVAHSFSGSKRNLHKSKPQDYLPFPNWEPEHSPTTQIDSATKKVLITLLRKRAIPMSIFTSLMTLPETQP